MAAGNKRGPKQVTAAHKAAMQAGRHESRIVREYLEALDAHKPRRGRKRTPDSIGKRLKAIDAEYEVADPLTRVSLVQERMNLESESATLEAGQSLVELEEAFVATAKSYSERKGITYGAWREVGVPPSVLKAAGVSRSGY